MDERDSWADFWALRIASKEPSQSEQSHLDLPHAFRRAWLHVCMSIFWLYCCSTYTDSILSLTISSSFLSTSPSSESETLGASVPSIQVPYDVSSVSSTHL
jgi:hypothetical protein